MPVYNEASSLEKIVNLTLRQLHLLTLSWQLIIVNDGSTDESSQIIASFVSNHPQIVAVHLGRNRGKGYALRRGLRKARGKLVIIQDADLEYHPRYYGKLIRPLMTGRADVVLGSRLMRLPLTYHNLTTIKLPLHFLANKILSRLASLLYRQSFSDIETGYKAFTRDALAPLHLTSNRFDIEVEFIAKASRAGLKIVEVPITTKPRDYSEGKKITATDGIMALIKLLDLLRNKNAKANTNILGKTGAFERSSSPSYFE